MDFTNDSNVGRKRVLALMVAIDNQDDRDSEQCGRTSCTLLSI